jgi:uracil-DNA glycosylase
VSKILLVDEIRSCTLCQEKLPLGARPVLQFSENARILIAGQAPGKKVHLTGIPFDDASGERLKHWLGVTEEQFYDEQQFAILPMGFCFPGTGKSGDLPPRPECVATWRKPLLDQLPNLQMTVVLGQYAQKYHMQGRNMSVTERVKAWRDHWPTLVPLPHPSPRNNIWLYKNSWFEQEVIPVLQSKVSSILAQD